MIVIPCFILLGEFSKDNGYKPEGHESEDSELGT